MSGFNSSLGAYGAPYGENRQALSSSSGERKFSGTSLVSRVMSDAASQKQRGRSIVPLSIFPFELSGHSQFTFKGMPIAPTTQELKPTSAVARELGASNSVTSEEFAKNLPDPNFVVYYRMLKMGVHREAVRHKIIADGYEPSLLEAIADVVAKEEATNGVRAPPPPIPTTRIQEVYKKECSPLNAKLVPTSTVAPPPELSSSPRATRVADAASTRSPKRRGSLTLDSILNVKHARYGIERGDSTAGADVGGQEKGADDVKTEFWKMLKIGVPAEVVARKMLLEGFSEDEVKNFINEKGRCNRIEEPKCSHENGNGERDTTSERLPSREGKLLHPAAQPRKLRPVDPYNGGQDSTGDEGLGKYTKMKALGLPEQAIRQRMLLDGVDPELLYKENPMAIRNAELPLREDPKFAQYFRMLSVGLPFAAVEHRMVSDGLDPAILSLDGDQPLSSQKRRGKTNSKAAATGLITSLKSRASVRKKLYWRKLPEDRIENAAENIWNGVSLIATDIELGKFHQLFIEASKGGGNSRITNGQQKNTASALSRQPSSKLDKKRCRGGSITLMDPKRSHNIAIVLARVKVSFAELRDRVLEMDTKVLTPAQVQSLIELWPTEEEVHKILTFSADVEQLSMGDQFFREISRSRGIKDRLNALAYKQQFPHKLQDIRGNMEIIAAALNELRESSSLRNILQIVLVLGNILNGEGDGSANTPGSSAVRGFSLFSLSKLEHTKSFDKKSTLLHFVVKIVQERFPSALHLMQEMPHVDSASKMALGQVSNDIILLRRSFQNLPTGEDSDIPWQSFKREVDVRLVEIESKLSDLKEQASDLLEYLCEDPSTNLDELFRAISDFGESFMKAKEDIWRKKVVI